MVFKVISLFPDLIRTGMETSIVGRGMRMGLISLDIINLKDFSQIRYGSVDDYPYGGGAGMLMQCEPIYEAYEYACREAGAGLNEADRREASAGLNEADRREAPVDGVDAIGPEKKRRLIFPTPAGMTFSQDIAKELSQEEELIFLCGHYEGVDERVLTELHAERYSIGDYVLTGGELPALVMMDAISRLIPGVLHNVDSAETESFENGLLEYPQYTRPEIWHDRQVPPILLSGNHEAVDKWRMRESIRLTKKIRPDLYREWLKKRGIE